MPNIQIYSYTGQNLYPRIKTSNVINDAGFLAVSDSGSSGGVLVNTSQGPKWKNLYAADGYTEITSVSNNKIHLTGNNIPIGVETYLGNYYPIEKSFLTINSDSVEIDISPYLVYDNVSTFTAPWKVWFSGAHLSQEGTSASQGQEIYYSSDYQLVITPQDGKVYVWDVSSNPNPQPSILIYTSAFSSSRQITFQVHIIQGNSYRDVQFDNDIIFGNGSTFPAYTGSEFAAQLHNANTLHCVVVRWDGTRLLANLAYTVNLS